jgi:predicted anti-sigma-YlaC factor YlaD
MLSCKEAAQFISRSLDRRLNLSQKLRLFRHLLVCAVCRRYRRQVGLLRRFCEYLEQDEAEGVHSDSALSSEARERMKSELRRGVH